MTTQSTSTPPAGRPAPGVDLPADVARRLADSGLAEDAVALVGAFGVFGPAYQRWLGSIARRDGMSIARMKLLWVLRTHGAQQMSEVKDRLGVTARNVTQLVDALEQDGLVRRVPHPTDRRATILELTDTAFSVLDEAFVGHTADVAGLFERLDPQDRADLLRIVRTLTEHLQDVGVDHTCEPPPL